MIKVERKCCVTLFWYKYGRYRNDELSVKCLFNQGKLRLGDLLYSTTHMH